MALLKGAFAKASLARLREAAARCFEAVERGEPAGERYRFNRSSNSLLLAALAEYGCEGEGELTAPLTAAGLGELFEGAMGRGWTCRMEESWARKKFAPMDAPASGYHLQDWHQDGALGVRFPLKPGAAVVMTELMTCWIPLDACGVESPGLEFVRGRQPGLLHFTELGDAAVRGRFGAEAFWAPGLELGDGVVFMNDVLHRTHVRPGMRRERLSVEYRIFPGAAV